MGSPKVSVVFLLYNAEKSVASLVEAIRAQTHPDYPDPSQQAQWLEVLFMDDRSKDSTVGVLERELKKAGSPAHYRTVFHSANQGLSRTLNGSFELARAPFALTCHCDCLFGSPRYVAGMLALMEKNPRVAAITGQPALPEPASRMPLAEKVNVITNLMDVFPPEGDAELTPAGFAEGRCDIFRIQALREVGFYDTRLRIAGEDQVLAGRLRDAGYQICLAPKLVYELSVSDEQDSLRKLMRHLQLFGRSHPYILLKGHGTGAGILGPKAGANRRLRAWLRLLQIASCGAYLAAALFFALGVTPLLAIGILTLVFALKLLTFQRHLRAVPLSASEWMVFLITQPLLDLYYTWGLLQGVWILLRATERTGVID